MSAGESRFRPLGQVILSAIIGVVSRTVFILGAGASAEAGGPLMTDFLDAADEIFRRGVPAGDPLVQQAFELFFKARAALQDVHAKATMDLFNIEAVLGAFEMAGLLNRLRGLDAKEVSRLPAATRQVITTTLEWSIRFQHTDRIYPPTPYQAFVELLKEISKSRFGGVSVITFNYDVALDYALRFMNMPIDYCFDEPVENAFPLMKLHESLNWAQCSECQRVLPLLIDDYFSRRHILAPGPDAVFRLPITVDLNQQQHCGRPCPRDPLIVPPTWNKAQYHKNIGKVWQRAARELSDAENVIVVGYSLPDSDEFFHYFLPLGIIGPNIIRRFIVFDPAERVKGHYERLLSPATLGRFEMAPSKFSDSIYTVRNRLGLA